ncbi:MAG: ArnT family glycosyltransferase [Nitrospinales bacterium]
MEFADVYEGLFVYRTWFPYYIQAFSLWVLGHTTFAARFPFALCGVFSVLFLYVLTLKLTSKKTVAFLASLFLASSVPAILYFRTARYIGFPILLTILLIFFYMKMYDEDKKWNLVPFAITSILYFHSMYVEFAGTILGIFIHFLLHRKTLSGETQKKVLICMGVIIAFTLPWIIFISPVFQKVYQVLEIRSRYIDVTSWGYLKRFFAFLFQLNNYIFPFIVIPVLFLKRLGAYKSQIQLLVICTLTTVGISVLHYIPLQNYIASVFPLVFILLALIIAEGFRAPLLVKTTAVLLLISTNIFHVGPLLPVKKVLVTQPGWFESSQYLKGVHSTFVWQVDLFSIYFKYLYEISHPYKGPLDAVVAFFNNRGKPGDTCVIDREGISLAFYTGMKLINKNNLTFQDTPDWIILRSKSIDLDGEKSTLSSTLATLKTIVQSNPYEKFVLNAPVNRINNSYEIQLHKFQIPAKKGKIYIYKLIKPST